MSKKKKLYNLRTGIMCEIEKVTVLLEQIINNENVEIKTGILAEIVLEKTKKISKMNEKIGVILKL
ncbi:MAG: hypothetical protein A2104_09800 [Candidatus Melainabacteria bacterium GWF2_32_7]|nr:MAG: hypothetical protein A2104_09800 [Candidatus Melainabacteria bacterium GWF2_32_7]